MSTLEDQVREEQEAHDADADQAFGNTPAGQDAAEGKLFDVPRVKVQIDTTDPSVLKLAFSGQVEIDRGIASEVDFFNRLVAGKGADLQVHAHVAGTKTTHRRDSEGNVDAVLATRSLIITDVTLLND